MIAETKIPDDSVSLFVKNIQVFENDDPESADTLPFYADGYPGIIFQRSDNGMFIRPQDKQMPVFFLYGQTIQPVELYLNGRYKFVAFQLYPFVIRTFFNLDPRSLNDGCYDLSHMHSSDLQLDLSQLNGTSDTGRWINIVSSFLTRIFQRKREKLDEQVRRGVMQIIAGDGHLTIGRVRETLAISERAFERRFLAQVGVTPKQFSKMIQFQSALSDLQGDDFARLTDIVYKNGYADQSHFVRVFKAFTGVTPTDFKSRLG